MSFTLGVVLFAIGIGVSIALHEFGHLLTAKAFGMKATRYFIGFGPTLFSFRRGETEYGLKAVPAGGFVSIVGMSRAEQVPPADRDRAFWRFPAWQRTVVLAAGSVTHFLLAIVAIFLAAVTLGLPTDRAVVESVQPCVVPAAAADGSVRNCQDGDPAAPALSLGLVKGDRITSVAGQPIATYEELLRGLRARPGQTVEIGWERDGRALTGTVTVASVTRRPLEGEAAGTDGRLTVGAIGVAPSATERYGPGAAVGQTFRFTGQVFKATGSAIASFPEKVPTLVSALAGQQRDPTGPVSVVGASRVGGQALEAGSVLVFVLLFAGFNIFIGVFNLFPLLPLDGGHVAVLWFEQARSRIARALGRRDPGPVDLNKLVPLTILVIVVFGGISAMAILADIVNPIANPFR
ncbi:MAG TPA: site-2 protease family protein [Mycobacteriales bacterium]